MENQNKSDLTGRENKGFVTGLLLGGLAGAGAMLLLAPKSGKRTRHQIQEKSIEVRDQAIKSVEDTLTQVRTTANQITNKFHKGAEDLQHHGQELLDEQKDRWAPVVEAGKKAVEGA